MSVCLTKYWPGFPQAETTAELARTFYDGLQETRRAGSQFTAFLDQYDLQQGARSVWSRSWNVFDLTLWARTRPLPKLQFPAKIRGVQG